MKPPRARRRSGLLDGDSSISERVAQLAARVVQRLVERPARGVQALGEDVDRNAIDRQRNQDAALMAGQVRVDALRECLEEFNVRGAGAGAVCRFGEPSPAL